MSRYFFSLGPGEAAVSPEGTELADVDAAGREAVRLLGERLQADPARLWRDEIVSLVVTNEAGLTLFSVDASLSTAPAMAGLRGRPKGSG